MEVPNIRIQSNYTLNVCPLSSYIIQYGYAGFYDFFSSFSLPDEIQSFLKLNQRTFHKLGEEAYDFERFITPEVLELKSKFSSLK